MQLGLKKVENEPSLNNLIIFSRFTKLNIGFIVNNKILHPFFAHICESLCGLCGYIFLSTKQ